MKIGLSGVPRHPKGHAHVRYGLVLTNYDMIRAKPSSFDIKAMQPRMWWVIFVKGLSGKLLFYQGLNFLPTSRCYKMTSREGLIFFQFF
jgi:hypothetical protein